MLRVIRNIVSRNPRFRKALGDVSLSSNTQLNYKDVQCVIKDISAQGIRLSPDYFMGTQYGRAILAKIGEKEGSFFEWVDEIDPTRATPASGVYLFQVNQVNEQTREVDFVIESYNWFEGTVQAQGSCITFAPGIDATTVTFLDPTTGLVPTVQAAQSYVYLLTTVVTLQATDSTGRLLTPLVDYWVERQQTTAILNPTIFGPQTAQIPAGMTGISLVDQDGFVLRPYHDYIYTTASEVQFSAWTPAGATISAQGTIMLDPTVPGNCMNPENTLNFQVGPGESLVADQVFVTTSVSDNAALTVNPDGTVTLAVPLPPGGYCQYEARVLVGQSTATGMKMGSNTALIPGLRIAIGDAVMEGDQCAILVSPTVTQTYHVYGSKDSISFALDVKANDPATASDLAELLKQNLLIHQRTLMESDGITVLEASRSAIANQRDRSGTSVGWVSTLQITALADWRVFNPLVTRITSFDIQTQPRTAGYPNRILPASRYAVSGVGGFLPDYR